MGISFKIKLACALPVCACLCRLHGRQAGTQTGHAKKITVRLSSPKTAGI